MVIRPVLRIERFVFEQFSDMPQYEKVLQEQISSDTLASNLERRTVVVLVIKRELTADQLRINRWSPSLVALYRVLFLRVSRDRPRGVLVDRLQATRDCDPLG